MIKEYLSKKALVRNVSTINELEKMVRTKKQINMMMGQTFDYGQPVDLMKYALFIMNLSDLLKEQGSEVRSNWLIADHFIVDINKDEEVTKAQEQVRQRINYLQKLNGVYNGDIGFVLSSKLSKSEGYKKNLDRLFTEVDKNTQFKDLVLESIPKDRRDNPDSLRYPLEELATIQTMGTNVKVGPPYEVLYDKPSQEFAPVVGFNKYVAVQLTNSFPFGKPEISKEVSKEVEKFGVLPYKKGSKGLGEYRIDPLNDSLEVVRSLIYKTKDIRALVDLSIIAEMAGERRAKMKVTPGFFLEKGVALMKRLGQETFERGFPSVPEGMHVENLIDSLIPLYESNIYKPLH